MINKVKFFKKGKRSISSLHHILRVFNKEHSSSIKHYASLIKKNLLIKSSYRKNYYNKIFSKNNMIYNRKFKNPPKESTRPLNLSRIFKVLESSKNIKYLN